MRQKYTLLPPGSRKGNTTWIIRGTLGGRRREVDTKARHEAAARRFAEDLERSLDAAGADLQRGHVTFSQAADLYLSAAPRSKNEVRYVEKLKVYFRNKLIDRIRGRHISQAASDLYPTAAPETKNRQVFTVVAAILHHAAEEDLCAWLRVKKLEESDPAPRNTAVGTMGRLIKAAAQDRDMRRLLKTLAYQGWRITETLGIRWEHIDLVAETIAVRVGKARTWKLVTMHPEVLAELRGVSEVARTGPLFPWRRRERLYPSLRRLCQAAGVSFTPHQARHDFASDLNDEDVSAVDIVNVCTWTSTKSVERYIKTHRKRAKVVLSKLPPREAPEAAEVGEKVGAKSPNVA
jgi:integrase